MNLPDTSNPIATPSTAASGSTLTFPPSFVFGTATAAHQVEGDNKNSDWWDFEQQPGRIHDGTTSGRACEHYSRFREDLDLITGIHNTAYRFSVEWAKIEPEPGQFDQSVLDHYREVIATCRAKGLEPLVTLYHFVLPRWFAQKGGWLNEDSVEAFTRYVTVVRDALGEGVTWWVTINEPMVYLYHAYLMGMWPPAERNFLHMAKAGRSLLRAHIEAYKVLRAKPGFGGKDAQVGIAKHLRVFDPMREGNSRDLWAANRQAQAFNWAFLDSLETGDYHLPMGMGGVIPGHVPCQDFVGINYYTRDRVQFAVSLPATFFGATLKTPNAPLNDLGWEIYPDGITRLIRTVHEKYGKPIWITENGIADTTDAKRPAFVVHHLAGVAKAVSEGIPVLGYFHWSLYDNFEWADGYAPRFGLYAVDYQTQARTLRAGGKLYGEIARTRTITPQMLEQYRIE